MGRSVTSQVFSRYKLQKVSFLSVWKLLKKIAPFRFHFELERKIGSDRYSLVNIDCEFHLYLIFFTGNRLLGFSNIS